MKVIVNCKTFRKVIKQAFDVDCHVIQYMPSQGSLIFGTTKYQSDIVLPIEKQYPDRSETIKFNNFKMAKLHSFLGLLKEQPIVVEIDEEDIKVTGSIVEF